MKNNKKIVKKSIINQLVIRCVLVITCTVFFTWFIDIIFLEKYYVASKKTQLQDIYDVLDEYEELEGHEEELKNIMSKISATYNVDYVITEGEGNDKIVFTSVNDEAECLAQLDEVSDKMKSGTVTVIEETEDYLIANIENKENDLVYITMVGNLSDGSRFMLRSALDGIKESIRTFNVFLFWAIMASIVLSSIPIVIMARGISKPIRKLNDISQKMADLDFTAKYETKHANELDALGDNLNHLSETLEETICKLQGANAELTKDVEQKIVEDRVRKEFVANVSHELKTPIALISGYAEGLRESVNDDPESREFYCDVIMDEARKMNRMVRELMSLSYFESGGYVPDYSHFNINELLQNSINSKDILIKNKGQDISVLLQKESEDMYVWADEYLIEEVFSNYFTNAINHVSEHGSIVVKAEYQGVDVKVSVHNTGEKIPEESIDSIWDKFYKVDKARSREYGGSGIGLSIVKAVMEAHKGSYGVVNERDGVTFWFTLLSKCDIEQKSEE